MSSPNPKEHNIHLDNVSGTNLDRQKMGRHIFPVPHFLLLHRKPIKRQREDNIFPR
jgi:hypothetical protein